MAKRAQVTKSIAVFAALGMFLSAGNLRSDSYRCGSKLVRTGDSAGRVLELCGQPAHKDRGHERIRIGGGTKEVSVQRWYYKKGSQSLGRIVMLYRGEVVAIDTRSR